MTSTIPVGLSPAATTGVTAANVTTVSSFCMSAHEITQAQYVAVTGKANPSSDKTGTDAPDRAVDTVSWYDALVFCNSGYSGGVYTTGCQKEFAGDPNPETTGASPLAFAWYMGNLSDYRPHAVGSKTPNELGLYDMSGNVAEWCYDWSADYPAGAQLDPANNRTAFTRILRGGSWYRFADNLKLNYRDDDYFAYGAYDETGLRVVCRP